MGALAAALKELGLLVTGSDDGVYPPMSEFLAKRGIVVNKGFSADNLAYGPDLVIVGNAVKKDNPEAVRVFETGLPYCSMPQAINRFMAKDNRTIVVTGTHGKTTTSSIAAWLLYEAGLDPSFLIGGILKNFGSSYRVGKGGYMVIEGDEYDTAFFDKQPKFMHYRPDIAVWTGAEFDHADIFSDFDHVKSAFEAFFSGIPEQSPLVGFGRDPNAGDLLENRRCRVETYGEGASDNWRLEAQAPVPPWNRFSVYRGSQMFGRFRMKLPGAHNRLNALAAIAAVSGLGIGPEAIAKGLETFEGIRRRQEIRGVKNDITVIDDFAHHPTAVRETIGAIRSVYPENRLIAVFEPRTNTSMRNVFQEVYPFSFDGADMVCVRKPPLLHKVPEDMRFSSRRLAQDLKKRGISASYFGDTEGIIKFLTREATAGDVVLVMSNGGFDDIHNRLLEKL
ncbi:MAG: UDP-N-acetylmuramate--L-alanine ligase [Desulfobacteraceae bacterium]|nr:UDP-N-acetylmuramate--L-alanine ligase [Desulfobacteraceae bacterium]